jgi:tetratricopeptide (TPR) repeat protein
MQSPLIEWGRNAFIVGIVLALVLVIPTAWFPFQLTKVAAFSIALAIAALLFVLGGGTRELLRARGFYGALLVGLLPLSYLLSLQISSDPSVGWAGYSVEAGTVLFATLLFLSFIFAFAFFRTLRPVRTLLTVLTLSLLGAIIFQWLSVAFGTNLIPFATFADRSVNLIGKWNDLGLLVGLLALLMMVRAELSESSVLFRAGAVVGGLILVVLLGLINFPLVWALILVGALAIGTIKFVSQRSLPAEGDEISLARLPLLSGAAALIATTFLFFGTQFNTGLTGIFPVTSLEVRPSYQSTLDVHGASGVGSLSTRIAGTGPNTFGQQWLLHKPSEVNQSLFWNVDFNVGFSTLLTALGTVGLLGVIALLIPLALIIAAVARVLRYPVLGKEDRATAAALVVGSLFLYAALAFYVPSQNLLLLAFVLFGTTFGFLWRQGREAVAAQPAPSRALALGVGGAALVLLVLVLATSGVTVRRFVSEIFVNRGVVALQAGDATGAFGYAARAAGIETTGNVLRLAASAGANRLSQIANDTSLPQEQARADFEAMLGQTVLAGQQAAEENPGDYRPHLILASVYDFLTTLGVEGAYESAVATYAQAAAHNPQNPAIPLALARLEAARGNAEGARAKVTESLTLKPNYTDAILFVVQLDVAQNDIPAAIQAATAAAQTAPGVAPIWFQLGLLYYAAGNSANAVTALEQAVALVPDYANAKYFLGLSYYAQGRSEESIRQFEDLLRTNPGNAEVALILNNLVAGNPPFEGAVPPVTDTPEDRPTAPIEE